MGGRFGSVWGQNGMDLGIGLSCYWGGLWNVETDLGCVYWFVGRCWWPCEEVVEMRSSLGGLR